MNVLHSTLNVWRDKLAPISHTSTFRDTGQITPDEFVLAGDYLVYKFPSWSWADAATPAKRVPHLPVGKQFLVTRGVPCHRQLDDNFAGDSGKEDTVVDGMEDDEGDGWLRTGSSTSDNHVAKVRDVRTVDESGNVNAGEQDDDEEIPDMEDDDDEAIIRDGGKESTSAPIRTYNLYITYSPYYRTPRLYLSGYLSFSEPLPPHLMMEDIIGDYKDKTVTLEDFPFFDSTVKMASVHPCKHASVMKTLLDRADTALKIRQHKLKQHAAVSANDGSGAGVDHGLEGLVDDTSKLEVTDNGQAAGDEWEVLPHETEENEDKKVAIRVDQYLVVFLKFIASVTPGIEHDYTMGV